MDLIERAHKATLLSDEDYLRLAAFAGDEEKIRVHFEKTKELSPDLSTSASLGNQVALLQWLHDNVCEMYMIMETASQMGNLAVIDWALSKEMEFSDDCMWRAFMSQNVETLRQLKEKGCPVTRKRYQAKEGKTIDLEKLNWLESIGCPLGEENSN